MQKEQLCEEEVLQKLAGLEDLAEKKLKVYSRLLMDAALAKEMEELSLRHAKRKQALLMLSCGKAAQKNEKGESEE